MNIPLKRPPLTAQKAGDVYTFSTERMGVGVKGTDPPVVGCQMGGKTEAQPRRGPVPSEAVACAAVRFHCFPQEALRPSTKITSALWASLIFGKPVLVSPLDG